jgi:hypothetical protein
MTSGLSQDEMSFDCDAPVALALIRIMAHLITGSSVAVSVK